MQGAADTPVVYTVGHSTRSLEELVALLKDAGVRELVDVRSVPRSRRHPHFDGEALARGLAQHGIDYTHERSLGGFRRPQPRSPNRGWEQEAFQGYADHMASDEFQFACHRLAARARQRATCVMCAEAQWWRCHRRLLADALVAEGWRVLHLGVGREPIVHELTPFAVRGEDGALTYPPQQTALGLEGTLVMTSRNVELHRRLIEMFNANDLEAWIALADPRVEWHSRFATVGAVTVYRGHEGLRTYASDMDDVWGGKARVEVEAYFDLGEQTLAFYTLRARGKHSGAETSMWFAQVARWHDGRYFYGKAYVDREEALAELGISEHELQPIAP